MTPRQFRRTNRHPFVVREQRDMNFHFTREQPIHLPAAQATNWHFATHAGV
jgi:hypothetical protein